MRCGGNWALGALSLALTMLLTTPGSAATPGFESLEAESGLDLFVWRDVADVYVLRDGDAALLIDLGDGSVLGHLGELGIKNVEWLLLTGHHRELCQGHPKLAGTKVQVAAPEKERKLLEKPSDFRKLRPLLGDAFSVYGSSYVRPPVEPLLVHRGLKTMDTFTWRGHEFWCLETAGGSPGGMSYLLRGPRGWLAASGDVMLAGGKMHAWFDSEWDYGFAAGLYALIASTSALESFDPVLLLPAHGPVVRQAKAELHNYQEKLRRLATLYVRGYKIFTFALAEQDTVSRPSVVPHLWQTTPHLFKFKGANYSNFTLLLASSGRALAVDCGCLDTKRLDATLELAQKRLGLAAIDAVLITHMHGDHIAAAPHLRERWGAKIWTLDRIAEQLEQPLRFPYACPITAYGPEQKPVSIDRKFTAGEKFSWEGYELTVDWMPGQTEFGCCIQGMIDGRRVAFTGDNLFANPADPTQDGHEGVVAHNSAIFEEGYLYAAEYLRRLQPDLIMGGHSYVMDHPKELIERYHRWAVTIRDLYKELSAEPDYRLMFDPFWVRVDPCIVRAKPGETVHATVCLRNFLDRPETFRLAMHSPTGIRVEPAVLEGTAPAATTVRLPIRVQFAPTAPKVSLVAIDTTLDGRRYGEWFDFIVGTGEVNR